MEAKSNLNGANQKLEVLPDHDSEYWLKDADNRTFKTKQVSCQPLQGKGKHKFSVTKKAEEVKCECGVGYIIKPPLTFKNGHIYLFGELVV